jgi:hypothetical protein
MLLGNCPVSIVNGFVIVDYPDSAFLPKRACEPSKEEIRAMADRVKGFMARTKNVRFITAKALR